MRRNYRQITRQLPISEIGPQTMQGEEPILTGAFAFDMTFITAFRTALLFMILGVFAKVELSVAILAFELFLAFFHGTLLKIAACSASPNPYQRLLPQGPKLRMFAP